MGSASPSGEGKGGPSGRPSRARAQVLLVHSDSTRSIADKVLEELALSGIEATTRTGSRREARDAASRQPVAVGVWLKSSEKAIVFSSGQSGVRRRVVTDPSGSVEPDLLALHVSEVVRGELVSAGPVDTSDDRDGVVGPPEGAAARRPEISRHRFEFGVSPLIADGTFAELGAVLGVEVGYAVVPRLSLGPYLHLGLGRPSWAREPKHFSASQLGGGGEARWAILARDGMGGRLESRFGLGARSVAIRFEGGKEEDRATVNTTAVVIGLGAVYSVGLTRSLRLGLTGGYELGFVADFPEPPDSLGKKEQDALEKAAEESRVDGQFLLGVRLGATF